MKELNRILAENFECFINKSYRGVHEQTLLGQLTGGQLRKFSGETQEEAMRRLIEDVCYFNGLKYGDFELVKGDIKNAGVVVTNPGGSVNIGVDWHLYIYNKLVLVNECKSYLDAAFLSRAYAYINMIKQHEGNEDVKSIVTALESAVDQNTLNFYMYNDVIDRCYFFTAGKRLSVKPLYLKENWRPLNTHTVISMVSFIDGVVKENIEKYARA